MISPRGQLTQAVHLMHVNPLVRCCFRCTLVQNQSESLKVVALVLQPFRLPVRLRPPSRPSVRPDPPGPGLAELIYTKNPDRPPRAAVIRNSRADIAWYHGLLPENS